MLFPTWVDVHFGQWPAVGNSVELAPFFKRVSISDYSSKL
jgi:hypothetical protein